MRFFRARASRATVPGTCVAVALMLTCDATTASAQDRPDQASNRGGVPLPDPDQGPLCDQHPSTGRETIQRALDEHTGIRTLRLESREAQDELRAAGNSTVGGGACDGPWTPRGRAAATVGALFRFGKPHCSAVLVSPTVAVTAAHCLSDLGWTEMEFLLGEDTNSPVQRSGISSAVVHRQYDARHLGVNDIGVVYLKRRMDVPTLQPPTERLHGVGPNDTLLYVGYGIAGPRPGSRRCVDIPFQQSCATTFSYEHRHMNTCHGDSGGGVFLSDGSSLVGLTLWGDSACARFGISADVGSYYEWAFTHTNNDEARLVRPPARIDDHYRPPAPDGPDEVLTSGAARPEDVPAAFESRNKGRWVTWPAKIEYSLVRDPRKDYAGACDVRGRAGRHAKLLLQQFPDGCVLKPGQSILFTGRLSALQPQNLIEIALPEVDDGRCPARTAMLDGDLRAGLDLYDQQRFEDAIPYFKRAVVRPELTVREKACGFLWLAHSHDKVAQLQTQAAMDAVCEAVKLAPYIAPPEGTIDLYARARERCLPAADVGRLRAGRLQAAIAVAFSLERMRGRDGEMHRVVAPLAFLGFAPAPEARPHFAVGVAVGAGTAPNAHSGAVIAATVRADVSNRIGLIAGHGLLFADRLRHGWGVGVTVRLWSLTAGWQ
jgi:hypothetical protein